MGFKAGDVVKCIDGVGTFLIEGVRYTVKSVNFDEFSGSTRLILKDVDGTAPVGFYAWRFELDKQSTIKRILDAV